VAEVSLVLTKNLVPWANYLESGEFSSISELLCPTLKEVRSSVERASLEDNQENKQSILRYSLIIAIYKIL
jgi:hypothetical protein